VVNQRNPFREAVDPQTPDTDILVKRGLLPETLPSLFTSEALAAPLRAAHGNRYGVSRSRRGKLAPFNSSKRGEQRRMFAIPHPLFHRDASLFFEKNWPKLSSVLELSTGSASKPQFPRDGFRAVEITPQAELPAVRLKALARKKFCLITDVSRCFPSIYTHAIPWAVDGKDAAKKDPREDSVDVVGNRLDFIARQAQDRQTTGIPIGPDTSRLISELILSRIDGEFVQNTKRVLYVRHVDDYWIGGETYDECMSHLRRLRLGLAEYQLDINESKTRIVTLSEAIGETWPTDLKNEIDVMFPRWGRVPRQQDATALFAKVVDLATKTHDEGIIKFFIRRVDRASAWSRNWEILEPFLAHCAVQFPHAVDYVARVIAWRVRLDAAYDKKLWREVALTVAAQAATLGHDSELLWALWLLKEMRVLLPAKEIDRYTKLAGPLVLAFLAHAAVKGLTRGNGLLNDLQDRVVGDEQFAGSLWPVSLELYHLDHARRLEAHRSAAGAVLSALHAANVSIVDWEKGPRVFEREADAEHDADWEPEYAIEDYASAYDEDEEEAFSRPRRVSEDDDDFPF
jgi:Reverse transcriptase (RNA-dependent DNA polymerase)